MEKKKMRERNNRREPPGWENAMRKGKRDWEKKSCIKNKEREIEKGIKELKKRRKK